MILSVYCIWWQWYVCITKILICMYVNMYVCMYVLYFRVTFFGQDKFPCVRDC